MAGGDGALAVVAAGSAALGAFAVATGSTWAGAASGGCALATAFLAVRGRVTDRTPTLGGLGATERPSDLAHHAEDDEGAAHELDAIDEHADVGERARHPSSFVPEHDELSPSRAGANDPDGPTAIVEGDEFLDVSIRSRVSVARRALRPLAVVHVEILLDVEPRRSLAPERLRQLVVGTLRESDLVGCCSDGTFVFVLEDTAEDGAVWTTERFRRHLQATVAPQRFAAGVATYPAHGLDAGSVRAKAAAALVTAREWHQDRIEVATTP